MATLLILSYLLSLSPLACADDCLFSSTVSAADSAADFAVSSFERSEAEGVPRVVRFATAALGVIPDQLIENRPPLFFESLLKRRHNSRNWLWSSAENDDVRGTAMAHVIYCSVEMFKRSSEPHRRSLCISKVAGDQTQTNLTSRCNTDLTTLVRIGDSGDQSGSKRNGTMACWCEAACNSKTAVFVNETSGAVAQQVESFAVVEERTGGMTLPVLQYERENDQTAEQWFQDNLVQGKSPVGKGLFPRQAIGGAVLKSLRIINVLEPFSVESQCSTTAGVSSSNNAQDDVGRRTTARIEEELGLSLQQGISVPLSKTPARRSEIGLAVVASLVAAVAFEARAFVVKIAVARKEETGAVKRALLLCLMALVLMLEAGLELIPIYLLLAEEIAARRLVETRAFEIIGVGNELAVAPLFKQSAEQFLEATAGVVVIVLRNKKNSVALLAVAATLLTTVSFIMIGSGVRKARRAKFEEDKHVS